MNLADFKKFNLPDGPGVYFFKKNGVSGASNTANTAAAGTNVASASANAEPQTLYIGKATSLRDRVRSYMGDDLIKTRGMLLVDMIAEADTIEFQETDSVLEAFILESELIKKFQPRYNTKEKDNKSFNYVVITKEDFPRVLIVRGRNLEKAGQTKKEQLENLGFEYTDVFGPFPFGAELREAMKLVRKIFPYRDTCVPFKGDISTPGKISSNGSTIVNTHQKGKPCFNRSIGLCPGVCTGEISKEEYAEQVDHIVKFFKGKKRELIVDLEKEMQAFAKEQRFEEAHEVKKTLNALTHIQDISLIKKDAEFGNISQARFSKGAASDPDSPFQVRAEAYDIAHLSGKDMVGVMVVMEDGVFAKHEYKKFNIRQLQASNDTGALKQMLERRFNHTEWPTPTHIVIDGGKAQLNAAEEILKKFEIKNVVLVSVLKDDKHKAKDILRSDIFAGQRVENFTQHNVENPAGNDAQIGGQFDDGDIISLNQECHRFAIATHRKRRSLSRGL